MNFSTLVSSCLASASDVKFNYYDFESWPGSCGTKDPQQSPILIETDNATETEPLKLMLDYTGKFTVQHELQVDDYGNEYMNVITSNDNDSNIKLTYNSIEYTYSGMHSHWGSSEHIINNVPAQGSIHSIFKGTDTGGSELTLVIETMINFTTDPLSADIAAKDFPDCPTDQTSKGLEVNYNPFDAWVGKTATHYIGSLTTPPCTTPVHWVVINNPIVVEESEAGAMNGCAVFAAKFPRCEQPGECPEKAGNYRPTQPVTSISLTQLDITRVDTSGGVDSSGAIAELPRMALSLLSMILF